MHRCFRHSRHLALPVAAAVAASAVLAQPKAVPDGRWRANIGLAASYASGNTESTNLSLKAEAVRATSADRITANARALHGETDGTQTAAQYGLGGRYDYNVSARTYAFGQANYLRDELANLKMRLSGAGGIGYRLIDEEKQKFEVYAGLGYSREDYFDPTIVAGELRTSPDGRGELPLQQRPRHRAGQLRPAGPGRGGGADRVRHRQRPSGRPRRARSGLPGPKPARHRLVRTDS